MKWHILSLLKDFPGSSEVKNLAVNAGDALDQEFWRKNWQPTPVSLPGESRGQRSLEGYSP